MSDLTRQYIRADVAMEMRERAHDVEGLIAELEEQSYMGKRNGFSQKVVDMDVAIEILRKHFGKE